MIKQMICTNSDRSMEDIMTDRPTCQPTDQETDMMRQWDVTNKVKNK